MDSKAIRWGGGLALCLVAIAGLVTLTRVLPLTDGVAGAAIVFGVAVIALALADGGASPILYGIPSLMIGSLFLPDDHSRLLSFGLVLAGSVVAAASRWFRRGRTSLWRGLVLVVVALGPAKLLPLDDEGMWAAALALTGALAIVFACRTRGVVGLNAVLIAYASAIVAPAIPIRASLFAFVVAATILLLRYPRRLTGALFFVAIIGGGKWVVPIGLAVAAGFAFQWVRTKRDPVVERSSAIALPFVAGIPAASIAALSFAPDAMTRFRRVGVASGIAAALLAGGSLLVQPSLGTMYALVALACLLVVDPARGGEWSPAGVVAGISMIGLTAWSGVSGHGFPLPLPLLVIVLLSAVASASLFGDRRPTLASALVAGCAALVVCLHPLAGGDAVPVGSDYRLEAGESVTVELPVETKVVRLMLAGGNVVGIEGGTVVGVVVAEPGGETRDLKIGDFADWGVGRSEHYLSSNNPRLLVPAGRVIGEGRNAFLSGTGLVRLNVDGAERLTIEALPALGERGRLMIERVEVEK